MKARIYRSARRTFDCKLLNLEQIVPATALAQVLKEQHPVVGDWVELHYDEGVDQYEITKVLPRSNEIYRQLVREKKKKSIAANIDFLAIVSSVSRPVYKSGLVDRYLVRAHQWGIRPLIILNKIDEFDDQFDIHFEIKKYRELLDIDSFSISAKDESLCEEELEKLKTELEGKTVIFLGQSGVGKSKIISRLSEGKVELESRELAKGVGKGAHTTTWSELIDCERFELIDSPGVRSLAINDLSLEELQNYFPDLHVYMSQCKFNNCQHLDNSKGCAFNQLDPNEEQTKMILNRLASFLKMKEEVMAIPDWKRS